MRILVIDDEPQICRALRAGLERNGYHVTTAPDGEAGLDEAALHPPDLVILDLAMPRLDGLEVCRRLREWSSVPIIVLSVRDQDRVKAAALDAGADDYVTKPFSLTELLARIRAVARRAAAMPSPEVARFAFAGLVIDFHRRHVTVDGVEVRLTPIEYELLRVLALNAGRVVTYHALLTAVWGPEYAEDTHTLQVHVANLRNKIDPNRARPRYILTEPRVGYRFRDPLGSLL
jgi:two-component system KDP operon response regulator KdpE